MWKVKIMECKNCKYFESYSDDETILEDHGECHRYPPLHMGKDYDMFPKLHKAEWCGEYLPDALTLMQSLDEFAVKDVFSPK